VQQQIFNCPRCGQQNVAGHQFCSNCGMGLGGGGQQQAYNPQQWYSCPTCGQPVMFGVASCESCGTQLNWPTRKQQISYVPPNIFDKLPGMVRSSLSQMSPEKQADFFQEYKRRRKSVATGYLAWLFVGWHYLYIGKLGWQIAFWLSFGGLIIWWIIDVFRIPSLIRNYNQDIAIDIVRDVKIVSLA